MATFHQLHICRTVFVYLRYAEMEIRVITDALKEWRADGYRYGPFLYNKDIGYHIFALENDLDSLRHWVPRSGLSDVLTRDHLLRLAPLILTIKDMADGLRGALGVCDGMSSWWHGNILADSILSAFSCEGRWLELISDLRKVYLAELDAIAPQLGLPPQPLSHRMAIGAGGGPYWLDVTVIASPDQKGPFPTPEELSAVAGKYAIEEGAGPTPEQEGPFARGCFRHGTRTCFGIPDQQWNLLKVLYGRKPVSLIEVAKALDYDPEHKSTRRRIRDMLSALTTTFYNEGIDLTADFTSLGSDLIIISKRSADALPAA